MTDCHIDSVLQTLTRIAVALERNQSDDGDVVFGVPVALIERIAVALEASAQPLVAGPVLPDVVPPTDPPPVVSPELFRGRVR